nr:zinc finger BED domain-containing protein RICESLEEPER 2-like [Ipomoea batatas]
MPARCSHSHSTIRQSPCAIAPPVCHLPTAHASEFRAVEHPPVRHRAVEHSSPVTGIAHASRSSSSAAALPGSHSELRLPTPSADPADDATTVNTAVDLEVESTGATASKGKSNTSEVWTYFTDIGPNEKGIGRSQCKGSKKLDIGLAREVFVVAIVEHDCLFAFAEYPGFRKYHKLLNPDAPMIFRNNLVSDINKLYLKEKNKLKQVLTSIPNRICLTYDLWTACTTKGYICLTSHFVDEKWKLNSKILAFDKMPPPHTGFELAQKMYEILKDWGIEKKVFSLTLDNAMLEKLYAKVEINPTKCQTYIEMLRKKFYKLYDQYVSAIGSSSSQPSSSTIMHSRVESQVAKKYPKRLFDDVLDVSDEIVEPVEISELDRYLEQPYDDDVDEGNNGDEGDEGDDMNEDELNDGMSCV